MATAARRSLFIAGSFSGAFALTWAGVGVMSSQGYPDAFAAEVHPAPTTPQVEAAADKRTGRIDALNREYACSTTGLDADVIPARTVVIADGKVRLTTFDEGWAMHLGELPGTLVSVCAR